MAKIYFETIKNWLIGLGIVSGTLITALFAYLAFTGAIEIIGYSGDMTCLGSLSDPCYAYINFTAKEDIFIYPIAYDPYGRDFIVNFNPSVKDWKLQRKWGDSWRDIDLNKSCSGTWCGLSNKDDKRLFSIAFRKNRSYEVRIVGYKNNPSDTIKWALNYKDKEYIDPFWMGIGNKEIASKNNIDIIAEPSIECIRGHCRTIIVLENKNLADISLLSPNLTVDFNIPVENLRVRYKTIEQETINNNVTLEIKSIDKWQEYNSTKLSWHFNFEFTRPTNRMASNEFPPNSKKLSVILTFSLGKFNISPKMAQTLLSSSLRGEIKTLFDA